MEQYYLYGGEWIENKSSESGWAGYLEAALRHGQQAQQEPVAGDALADYKKRLGG